jgi:TRAP-type uncharacterized transport system substrate-binding protein
LLAGSESLPEDEVMRILEVIFANTDAITDHNLRQIKPRLEDSLKGVAKEMLHPAARKFFTAKGLISGID